MKLFSSWVSGAAEIRHFVARPDNVLSNSGKDFYQPDWMHGVEAKAMWLVRISKVAKCIDPAFASRYYENLSVGVSLRAKELDSLEAASQGHLLKVEQKYWQLVKMRIL